MRSLQTVETCQHVRGVGLSVLSKEGKEEIVCVWQRGYSLLFVYSERTVHSLALHCTAAPLEVPTRGSPVALPILAHPFLNGPYDHPYHSTLSLGACHKGTIYSDKLSLSLPSWRDKTPGKTWPWNQTRPSLLLFCESQTFVTYFILCFFFFLLDWNCPRIFLFPQKSLVPSTHSFLHSLIGFYAPMIPVS